jgi:CBS domain-containing protein
MKVADLMSRDPRTATPDEDVVAVARRMAEHDLGFLPVMEGRQLVGAITDRDIVIRHVATGAGASLVRDVMTGEARSCRPQDPADEALGNMGRWQLRRLPVVDEDAGIVGILSLADAARERDPATAGSTLGDVTQPGGPHSRSAGTNSAE